MLELLSPTVLPTLLHPGVDPHHRAELDMRESSSRGAHYICDVHQHKGWVVDTACLFLIDVHQSTFNSCLSVLSFNCAARSLAFLLLFSLSLLFWGAALRVPKLLALQIPCKYSYFRAPILRTDASAKVSKPSFTPAPHASIPLLERGWS